MEYCGFCEILFTKPIVKAVYQPWFAIGKGDLLTEEGLDVTVDVALIALVGAFLHLSFMAVFEPIVEELKQRIVGGIVVSLT